MPRTVRTLTHGAVHHVISRFVDRSWQLAGDHERAQYLERLASCFERARWRLLGYALMSSHVHLLAEASDRPLASWAKPLHVGMAAWLNRRFGRLGPVFAARPYCETVDAQRVAFVLAYLHNNPVRAQVAPWAGASTWTSHRAYLGLDAAPGGLDIRRGLELCGFGSDADGRVSFDQWVRSCASQAAPALAPDQPGHVLSLARTRYGAAVMLGTPTVSGNGREHPIVAPAEATTLHALQLDPRAVVHAVGHALNVTPPKPRRRRTAQQVLASRAAIVLWEQTGQPRSRLARVLGVSATTACRWAAVPAHEAHAVDEVVARALALLSE